MRSEHATGVRFSIDPKDSESVIFSIFNSGHGIGKENHTCVMKTESNSPKIDLQASWRIPRQNLTPDVIEKLLDRSRKLDDLYPKVSEITGGKKLSIGKKSILDMT